MQSQGKMRHVQSCCRGQGGIKGLECEHDAQDILETWRLRTPNEWEPVSAWADILIWRNAIYNVVINAFKNVADVAPHLHQLGYRDKAWCGAQGTATVRHMSAHATHRTLRA